MAQELVSLLLDAWDIAAATPGVLRSSPADAQLRLLDGALRLALLFNPSHARGKRPVDQHLLASAPTSAPPPPPPRATFDFTKVRPSEVLCALTVDEEPARPPQIRASAAGAAEAAHVALVNVSPLMRGHSLLVFDVTQLKPQRLELPYLRYGIAVVHAASCADFALGFNGAGAWSSVNHLHLQCFFPSQLNGGGVLRLPIMRQRRRELFRVSDVVAAFAFPDWPMRCFAVSTIGADADGDAAFDDTVRAAWTLVQLLQTRGVPHNVLIARAGAAPSLPLVIVFPRQQQREHRVGDPQGEEEGETVGELRFAIAEVAGLVVAGSAAVFQRFSQETFTRIMRDEVSLAQDEAERIQREWRQQCESMRA